MMKSFLILWCIPLVLGYDAHPFRDCRDSLNSTECKQYEKYCEGSKKVRTLCKRTCGLCPAVSPMSCHATKFGCCWDNLTKSGENGEGCPACKDKSPYCFKYIDQCHFGHIKRACPIVCGVEACKKSGPRCVDDPTQARFCKIFKSSRFCEFDPLLMVQYCRKTCDLCHKTPEIHVNENVNPPREESSPKIVEEEVEEATSATSDLSTLDEEAQLQQLLKESSIVLKNKRNKIFKENEDKYLRIIEQLSKKEIENEIDDLVASEEKKKASAPSLPVAKKEVKQPAEPKVKDAMSSLAKITLVKDELERKTADILNDLIKDTIVEPKEDMKKKKDLKMKEDMKKKDDMEDMKKKEAEILANVLEEEVKKERMAVKQDEEEKKAEKKDEEEKETKKDEEKETKKEDNSKEIAKLEASLLDMLLKERTKKSTV